MTHDEDVVGWRGSELVDRDGDKVGTIHELYVDQVTGRPEWALAHTGLFGRRSTFVPLTEAVAQGDRVRVPYEKALIKDAPGIDPDGELTHEEEERLYGHYGLEYSDETSPSGLGEDRGPGTEGDLEAGGDAGLDETRARTSGREGGEDETSDALRPSDEPRGRQRRHDGASEEREARLEEAPSGRLRLVRHVVTEYVPVQRDEAVSVHAPGDDQKEVPS